jgi:hypothetical protein
MPPSNLSVPDDLTLTSNAIDLLALKGTSTPPIAAVHAPSTAPVDGDLPNNSIVPSIDETNDALDFRVKYSDGTLQTGILPFVPSTVTVGATGADFTTIQAAWNYLKGRSLSSLVTISVAAGTYTEALVLQDQPFASFVKIQGDTRTAAGLHAPTTGSITKSGNNCTITLVSAPPSDFTSSDFVVIGGTASAANVGRFPIVSIDVGNKTVTYTNASGVAEAVRVNTQVIFCPNRIIDFSSGNVGLDAFRGGGTSVAGFTLLSTSATVAIGIRVQGVTLTLAGCCIFGLHDGAYNAIRSGVLVTDANCSAVKCLFGFQASDNGTVICDSTYVAEITVAAYYSNRGSFLRTNNGIATNSNTGFYSQTAANLQALPGVASFNVTNGFRAEDGATLLVISSTARNNGIGYFSTWQSLLVADTTNANNSGNTTNYSPATSGTEGNTSALIRWS